MAICLVCGCSHKLAECPVCGYEVTFFYGKPTEKEREEELDKADRYRRNILGRVKMKIPVYSYRTKIRMEDRQLIVREPERENIIIEGTGMKINEPVWFDEEFCNLNRRMPIEYELVDINGNSKNCSEVFENTGMDSKTVKIGMILRPELKINVIVGNDGRYVCSRSYSLK